MSLAAKLPPLDDRTFDNIVAEARQRIPRYTAEWTDFNDGDTGIALLELFGWMTEMLIFRMNQTPELSYLKFLELIGIRLEPARPATAYVSLAVEAGFAQATVDVPRRTQFSATGAADCWACSSCAFIDGVAEAGPSSDVGRRKWKACVGV